MCMSGTAGVKWYFCKINMKRKEIRMTKGNKRSSIGYYLKRFVLIYTDVYSMSALNVYTQFFTQMSTQLFDT